MSTYRMIVHGVYCDAEGCGEMRDDVGSGLTYAELRKNLREEGWTFKAKRDLCPKHSRSTTPEEPE